MFCCSGERPRKGGVRFAKGLNTIVYKPKRKPDHNLTSRFCWGAKGRERKRGVRAFSGTIILDNPHLHSATGLGPRTLGHGPSSSDKSDSLSDHCQSQDARGIRASW